MCAHLSVISEVVCLEFETKVPTSTLTVAGSQVMKLEDNVKSSTCNLSGGSNPLSTAYVM